MKERPIGVPLDAVWIEAEHEWQLGTTMRGNKPPRGDCQAWGADGLKTAVYTLDAKGVQGTNMRFHPDSSLASQGEWKDGDRDGHFLFQQCAVETQEPYPANTATWRYEFDAKAWAVSNERWFLHDATPCTFDGRALAIAFDMDAVILISAPNQFLSRHAAACHQAYWGREPTPLKDSSAYADFWGIELTEFDDLRSTLICDHGFSGVSSLREFEGNCWEKLIPYAWANTHEELTAIFCGAAYIGGLGDSDGIYVSLFNPKRPKPERNCVYFWSHELYYLEDVIALNVDDRERTLRSLPPAICQAPCTRGA